MFNVLFQMVTHFNGGAAQVTDRRHQYEDVLMPIWPLSRSAFVWPPRAGFGAESFDELAASIVP